MGSGKSSVITPLLLLEYMHREEISPNQLFLVMPPSLVLQSYLKFLVPTIDPLYDNHDIF